MNARRRLRRGDYEADTVTCIMTSRGRYIVPSSTARYIRRVPNSSRNIGTPTFSLDGAPAWPSAGDVASAGDDVSSSLSLPSSTSSSVLFVFSLFCVLAMSDVLPPALLVSADFARFHLLPLPPASSSDIVGGASTVSYTHLTLPTIYSV